MRNTYQLEAVERGITNKDLQTATLIANLSRTIKLLTVDIEHEEICAGVRDVTDQAYPALARSLRARRNNLAATIATLGRLGNLHDDLADLGFLNPKEGF
jgi:hypothetical protein